MISRIFRPIYYFGTYFGQRLALASSKYLRTKYYFGTFGTFKSFIQILAYDRANICLLNNHSIETWLIPIWGGVETIFFFLSHGATATYILVFEIQ